MKAWSHMKWSYQQSTTDHKEVNALINHIYTTNVYSSGMIITIDRIVGIMMSEFLSYVIIIDTLFYILYEIVIEIINEIINEIIIGIMVVNFKFKIKVVIWLLILIVNSSGIRIYWLLVFASKNIVD